MSINVDLIFEKKPTSIFCVCRECQLPIKKDTERFALLASGYRSTGSRFYHPKCFLYKVVSLMDDSTKKIKKDWVSGVKTGIRLVTDTESFQHSTSFKINNIINKK